MTVGYPNGQAVADFLDSPALVELAAVHAGVIVRFARAYTRGNGFAAVGVEPDIAAVILAATARLLGNPDQLDVQVGNVRRRAAFKGWTLAERAVLDQYRGVAR